MTHNHKHTSKVIGGGQRKHSHRGYVTQSGVFFAYSSFLESTCIGSLVIRILKFLKPHSLSLYCDIRSLITGKNEGNRTPSPHGS